MPIAPDSQTRLFAVFGHPVSHSLSPAMHQAAFEALGLNAVYLAFDVDEASLPAALAGLQALGAGGVNLTIPLKRRAFEILPRLDLSARLLGAVNTVAFGPDGMTGYNTDGIGFLRDLQATADMTPDGRHVCIVGCGGAGRAISLTCATQGAATVTLANRTPDRSRLIAAEVRQQAPAVQVEVLAGAPAAWSGAIRAADLVVHCTPVGLHAGDESVLSAAAFRPGQVVYDLIYTVPVTPVMQVARAAGARVCNGLGMLVQQGAASFAIWTHQEPDIARMRAAIEPLIHRCCLEKRDDAR